MINPFQMLVAEAGFLVDSKVREAMKELPVRIMYDLNGLMVYLEVRR